MSQWCVRSWKLQFCSSKSCYAESVSTALIIKCLHGSIYDFESHAKKRWHSYNSYLFWCHDRMLVSNSQPPTTVVICQKPVMTKSIELVVASLAYHQTQNTALVHGPDRGSMPPFLELFGFLVIAFVHSRQLLCEDHRWKMLLGTFSNQVRLFTVLKPPHCFLFHFAQHASSLLFGRSSWRGR